MVIATFLTILLGVFLVCPPVFAAAEDYSTLRKFLSARMYGEAYNELLRQELSKDEFDPKLEKLRIDLLERTKERLTRQAKINPDDPAIFTILADIAFHQGKYEDASMHISRALNNKSGPMANYVFAKILFRKGNLSQAFDQMGTVLENMPDSPVVFEDFQFLYSCKSYGVATARKICRNTNFLKRSTPVAGESEIPEVPASPFENDPTQVAEPPPPADQPVTAGPTSIDEAQISTGDDTPLPDEEPPVDATGLPDEVTDPTEMGSATIDDLDPEIAGLDDIDGLPASATAIPRPMPMAPVETPTPVQPSDEDPEKENIKKAEYWLTQATRQFENGKYDDADNNWKKAVELHADLPGKDEIRGKIDAKFELIKRYKKAKDLFDLEKYDQALPILEEAYKEEPERFKEAAFFIGKIYLLRPEPDYDQALKYLDIVLAQKEIDPLFRRDIEWTKLEMFYGMERYEDANELFQKFLRDEEAFTRNQVNFNQLRYGLWYKLNKLWVNIGFGIFIVLFLIVFLLRLLPAISLSLADPLTSARRSFENKKYEKAISVAEKALTKKQPIQLERELLEILVKSHFELKNFVRCQENARIILEKFPGNTVAWGFLAKASMASHDTSNEAIAMYEAIYKENPAKTEYLPVLARHYAETHNTTLEAIGILFTYYQTGTKEPPVVLALADGYVQNRSMGNEVITVLEDALKLKDKVDYRELLARNFSKQNRYNDAARECIKVLSENINNMGIHVVYTSSMKKLQKVNEAVNQYKEFLQRYPGNPQLTEILNGLKKDAADLSSGDYDSLPGIPDELPMPDLPEPGMSSAGTDLDIDNFVEPPPEGFEMEGGGDIPLPDFLKSDEYATPPQAPAPIPAGRLTPASGRAPLKPAPITPGKPGPIDLPTLDPFDDAGSIFDDFSTELPEELGGPAGSHTPTTVNDFAAKNQVTEDELLAAPPTPAKTPAQPAKPATQGLLQKLAAAQEKAKIRKWDEVISMLSPDFASERNKEAGLLLADAWLAKGKAVMALEIIETLDFDPELMSDGIKEILYRTGTALESEKKFSEALRMYDMICSVDINYKDAFDRSDKIYSRKKAD